jgi:hypothetical protein
MRLAKVIGVLSILFLLGASVASFAQEQKYLELMNHLIDLKDWEGETANGMEVGDVNGAIIITIRDYHKEDMLLHTQIVVGKSAKKAWAQYDKGENLDTPMIVKTTMEESGHKVGISFEKGTKSGSIVIPLKVKNNDAIFSVAFVGMPYQEALIIAKRFSWTKMEETINSK